MSDPISIFGKSNFCNEISDFSKAKNTVTDFRKTDGGCN